MSKGNIPRVCEVCNSTFYIYQDQLVRGRGRFCSRTCASAARTTPWQERFLAKVALPDENGCRRWLGGYFSHGYGMFTLSHGHPVQAHRLSLEMKLGREIAEGLFACHTQNCNHPWCVSQDHLYEGTATENSRDMVVSGRSLVGEKHHNSKLTDEQAQEVLRLHSLGWTHKRIADYFEVSEYVAWSIINGKSWTHIPREDMQCP